MARSLRPIRRVAGLRHGNMAQCFASPLHLGHLGKEEFEFTLMLMYINERIKNSQTAK